MASGKPRSLQAALLSLNSQYVHSSLAPWCLRAGVFAFSKGNYEVRVLEGTVNEPLQSVAERIIQENPRVLGVSCYIWNIKAVKALLPLIRAALPQCVIVLGGPEVSFCPKETLEAMTEADFLIAGEGELPFARLLDALAGLGSLEDVPGLCHREGNDIRLSQPFYHEEMPPSPYGPEYFNQLSGRIAYIEASRGCPFACAFCLSGRERARPQLAPLERVFSEIDALAHSGTRTVKFVDRTFNAAQARADTILSHIIARSKEYPHGLTFHFEIAGDILAASTMEIIQSAPAGLFQFEIGLQSMDETTLTRVLRKTDMGRLIKNVRALIAGGNAHIHLDLIAGLPGEDLARFARGFDEAYGLGPHALQLGFLKLIHGSAMREDSQTYPASFEPEAPYTVTSTPWMNGGDFDTLRLVERALDKLHNSGRFHHTLTWLTRGIQVSPFSLFLRLGRAITEAEAGGALSLDDLTALVLDNLTGWLPEDARIIRDLMLLDRLASVPSSVLPSCLKEADARFFTCKRALKARFPRKPGIIRAMGFPGGGGNNKVAFSDYEGKDPVTGRWPVRAIPLARLRL
ncbi:MAG: DUF4080 domain-containing protein [Eubacteriales bacterium]|nr:DUF4080 domain-containing protein [Eubacteriales bacterium]